MDFVKELEKGEIAPHGTRPAKEACLWAQLISKCYFRILHDCGASQSNLHFHKKPMAPKIAPKEYPGAVFCRLHGWQIISQ